MRLAHLYILAKAIRKDADAYRSGMQITYTLNSVEHSELQKEAYTMINGNLTNYKEQSVFELSLLDIKFIILRG